MSKKTEKPADGGGIPSPFLHSSTISAKGVVTKDWYAWLNIMPPGPKQLHVIGDVQVGNPGVDAILVEHEPQGINPTILLLDLVLIQQPGIWPQHVVWKQVRYNKLGKNPAYGSVEILHDGASVASIKVEIIS
jgi:hypothetical protein